LLNAIGLFSSAIIAELLISSSSLTSLLSSWLNRLFMISLDCSSLTFGFYFIVSPELFVVAFFFLLIVLIGIIKLVMLYSLAYKLSKKRMLYYIKLPLLFLFAAFFIIIVTFPDFSTMISVPKAIIINNEIVVSPLVLKLIILIVVYLIKDLLCFLYLTSLIRLAHLNLK
jgi:hypothetical protein